MLRRRRASRGKAKMTNLEATTTIRAPTAGMLRNASIARRGNASAKLLGKFSPICHIGARLQPLLLVAQRAVRVAAKRRGVQRQICAHN
jgi:hypothetical protein